MQFLIDVQETRTRLKVLKVEATSYEEAESLALKEAEKTDFHDENEEQFVPTYKVLNSVKSSHVELKEEE